MLNFALGTNLVVNVAHNSTIALFNTYQVQLNSLDQLALWC